MKILSFLFLSLLVVAESVRADCDPFFVQINEDGFGNIRNHYAWSMAVFGEHLYVGTFNPDEGGEIWRYDGAVWEQVVDAGFNTTNNEGFRNLVVFGAYLYAGTKNETTGAEMIRTLDGVNWETVLTGGFSGPRFRSIRGMQVFSPSSGGSFLYLGLQNAAPSGAGILLRTADGTNFSVVNSDGFGDVNNNSPHTMAVFNDQLYIATRNRREPGLQVVRNSDADGLAFEVVVGPGAATPAGFGVGGNANRVSLDIHVHDGFLYVGTVRFNGFEIYRTADGVNYEIVVSNGLDDPGAAYAWRFASYEDHIWLGTFNILNLLLGIKGGTVWRSPDGLNWTEMVGRNGIYFGYGFDDSFNWGIRSFAVYKGKLIIGTANCFSCGQTGEMGTEIWEWSGESCP